MANQRKKMDSAIDPSSLMDLATIQHYDCSYCDLMFSSQYELGQHLQMHLCSKKIDGKVSTGGFTMFKCKICLCAIFKDRGTAVRHMITSHGQQYECKFCKTIMVDTDDRGQHMSTHYTKLGFGAYRCHECGELDISKFSKMKSHMAEHTATIFTCPFCYDNQETGNQYLKHLESHGVSEPAVHNADDNDFHICGVCEKLLFSEEDLEVHSRNIHPESLNAGDSDEGFDMFGISSEETEIDATEVSTPSQLEMYNRFSKVKSSPQPKREFGPCGYCGLSFVTVGLLNYHLMRCKTYGQVKILEGNVTHSCSFCGQVFRTKACRQAHLKIKHNIYNDHQTILGNHLRKKRMSSEPISVMFDTNTGCSKVKAHHGEPEPDVCLISDDSKEDEKETTPEKKETRIRKNNVHHKNVPIKEKVTVTDSLACKICSKTLSSKEELVTHLLSHVSDYVFQCTLCFKTFKEKSETKHHMALHNGRFGLICRICGKAFTNQKIYENHISKHKGAKLTCGICRKNFHNLEMLLWHKVLHFNDGQGSYHCVKCGQAFVLKRTFIIHKKKHCSKSKVVDTTVAMGHIKYSPFIDCRICVHGFFTHSKLKTHLSECH